MKQTRQHADSTRQKIIDAAQALFIEHGFAGTSTLKVAERAKVQHSLVFHHFKNKKNLWQAVKTHIVEKTQQRFPTLPPTDLPWPQFLTKLVHLNIAFYQSNPALIRLFNWQRLEKKQKPEIGVGLSAETKIWLNAFKNYQQQGEINSSLKTEYVLTFILSVVSGAALDPYLYLSKKDDFDDYLKNSIEMLLKALK